MPKKYIRPIQYNEPGIQKSSAQCGRGEQQLWGGGRTTPTLGLQPIAVSTPGGCVDRGWMKDVPGSIMFADGIVLCGDNEIDMEEYLETWMRALADTKSASI